MERLPPLELPPPETKSKGKAAPPKCPDHHPLVTAWRGFVEDAVATAGVGLGYLIDLALLLGVLESRLAGEPPAARAAWAHAKRVTAARRTAV